VIADALLAAGVGGLLWLDRFQLFQLMLSRPLVTASLVGLSLGDAKSGLAVGILFETLWLRRPPVGGYSPPDTTLAAAAAAAIAALAQREAGGSCAGTALLAFLIILPVCGLGQLLDVLVRRLLAVPAAEAGAILRGKSTGSLFKPFLTAVLMGFTTAFAALVPIIVLGTIVAGEIEASIPRRFHTAFQYAYFAVPLVGVGDMSVGYETKGETLSALAGFLLAAAGMLLLHRSGFFQ
jgi:mannose/fructose/N-acetylgalactosamine-specific phosphotransferase system component IIC